MFKTTLSKMIYETFQMAYKIYAFIISDQVMWKLFKNDVMRSEEKSSAGL